MGAPAAAARQDSGNPLPASSQAEGFPLPESEKRGRKKRAAAFSIGRYSATRRYAGSTPIRSPQIRSDRSAGRRLHSSSRGENYLEYRRPAQRPTCVLKTQISAPCPDQTAMSP